jgi:hypothetical protein
MGRGAAVSVGKRRRFEVLKRDGFRCHYCGATACGAALEVDHVVPKSKGGTDDPANLITACYNCNRGKSNVRLDERQIPEGAGDPKRLKEHAEQIRAYLAAQLEVDNARAEVRDYFVRHWCEYVDRDGCPTVLVAALPGLTARYPFNWLIESADAVGSRTDLRTLTSKAKYFYGCLRRRREGDRHA